jgi:hypothetical protein
MEKTKYRTTIVVAIISAVSTILVGLSIYFWPTIDTRDMISSQKTNKAMELVPRLLSTDKHTKQVADAQFKILYNNNPEEGEKILSIIEQHKLLDKERGPKFKFLLLTDETITMDANLIDYLNNWCEIFEFKLGKGKVKIDGEIRKNYNLDYSYKYEIEEADFALVLTKKRYFNNYFIYSSYDSARIYSFYAWNKLTDLSINNGIVKSIIFMISMIFDAQFRHEEQNTGCIYDFLWDKTGIDIEMRAAYICKEHLKILEKQVKENKQFQPVLDDLFTLLDEIGKASMRGKDIVLFNQANKESSGPNSTGCYGMEFTVYATTIYSNLFELCSPYIVFL